MRVTETTEGQVSLSEIELKILSICQSFPVRVIPWVTREEKQQAITWF